MECWHRYKTLVLIASVMDYLFDVKVNLFQNNIKVVTCNYIQIHFLLFPSNAEITHVTTTANTVLDIKMKLTRLSPC